MTQESKAVGKLNLLEEAIVINVGLEEFFESLKEQETQVIQVRWLPPAGGDEKMMKLLDDLL